MMPLSQATLQAKLHSLYNFPGTKEKYLLPMPQSINH